jgi:hypothetical protein
VNTTDDDQPLGESPDVAPGWVDAAAESARHTKALQAAIDDIRALLGDNMFRVPAHQIRNILNHHGV